MSKFWYSAVFFYYFLLFTFASSITALEMLPAPPVALAPNLQTKTLIASTSAAVAFSSLYDIRKLYKDSLQNKIAESGADANWFKYFGTVLYYLGRPLFAALFSLLVFLGSKLSVLFMTAQGTAITEGFFYVNVIASCYAGILTGRLVKQLEAQAEHQINKL